MKYIDENIIEQIKGYCNLQHAAPGALLFNPNVEGKNEQINFLANILEKVQPKNILETGTESAMFCYFSKSQLGDSQIVTFGLNEYGDNRSVLCTDFLNKIFGKYITFIEGDSKQTLTSFNTSDIIDFAWIDGGHDTPTLSLDLINCARLNIPHICVDDYRMFPHIVKPCVEDFVQNHPQYIINSISRDCDDRGIAYISLR